MSAPGLAGHRTEPWAFLGPAAEGLGFAAIGVAPAGPVPEPARVAFVRWIADGRHGAMGYLERHSPQRADPRHPGIVAEATAVVSAALPYGRGTGGAGIWRHVAAHARARDYHLTVSERLAHLARAVEQRFPGCRWRAFVDTAPVMERTWAVSAGLGSIGRHGGLLVPGVGARVVLGELVCAGVPVSTAPPPAEPFTPCGDCRLCIAACPTGAIVEPGVVDSRKCLSYHTIENQDPELPQQVAEQMELIFGCDACTEACPLENRSCLSQLDPPPVLGPVELDPRSVLEAESTQLAAIVAGTCLERTGTATIKRNARAVAAKPNPPSRLS